MMVCFLYLTFYLPKSNNITETYFDKYYEETEQNLFNMQLVFIIFRQRSIISLLLFLNR